MERHFLLKTLAGEQHDSPPCLGYAWCVFMHVPVSVEESEDMGGVCVTENMGCTCVSCTLSALEPGTVPPCP